MRGRVKIVKEKENNNGSEMTGKQSEREETDKSDRETEQEKEQASERHGKWGTELAREWKLVRKLGSE